MGSVRALAHSKQHSIMRFLVLSACVAAAAAQGFYGLQSFPNGAVVPVDEPAVAAARADHLALKGAIAPVGYAAAPAVGYAGYAAAPVAAAPAVAYTGYNAAPVAYAGPLNLNTQLIAHPNGAVVPVDEPAVAAARADHLATKGVVGGLYAGAAAPAVYGAGYAAGFYGL